MGPRRAPFDVEHYALDLELDPERRRLEGTCRLRLWALEAALETVALDLVGLEVEGVRDSAGRDLAFRQRDTSRGELDGALVVQLARPLGVGEFEELSVRYGGSPAKGLWFVAERAGTPTQVFTQGQCVDARWWFPCFDEPHDRATSELRVTLPAGWTSLAGGALVDSAPLAGGRRRDHWRLAVPHPTYLVTLVAGELEGFEEDLRGLPLVHRASPELAPWLGPSLAETARVLEVFEELTGARYPYPKYSQACVANFPFGGMENASATTMTETILRDERGLRDDDPTGLVAHEAAHQWFGDLLTCASWPEIWLNEGFATYFTQLYFERTRGVDAFRVGVRDMQNRYTAEDVGPARRPTVWNVYKDPLDLFAGGQAYPGGGSRLHLLRFVLGDETFFRGMRDYVARRRGTSVTTADLRRSLEATSGRDLGPFFEQWFERRGYPEFEVRWSWEGGEVLLDVAQVQAFVDGTPAVFRVPVEVEVRGQDGARMHRVQVDERRERFRLPAPERPVWVRFDKHGWIPKRLNETRSLGEWARIAEGDDDVNGRREALAVLGRGLGEDGVPADERRALRDVAIGRLERDEVAAVRRSAAWALAAPASSRDSDACAALFEAGASDEDAAVRVAALGALGGHGPDADVARYALDQFEAGYSWHTMAAAAALFARAQADPELAFDWLDARLALPSPHGELAARLLVSLANTGSPRVTARLRGLALDPAQPSQVREVAVVQLASAAGRDARLREELEGLYAAGGYRLQNAVSRALGACGDARARGALEDFHASCPDSRQRRIVEAALRRLSGA